MNELKVRGLNFMPRAGQILMCDFDYGHVPPEMCKVRPVVVVSYYKSYNPGHCLVVPLSTTAPDPVKPFHIQFPDGLYPLQPPDKSMWAKCDLVSAVSRRRLDRIKVDFRKYIAPQTTRDTLDKIRKGVMAAMSI